MIQPAASAPREVMTPPEAARYLRLDDDGVRCDKSAIRSLDRLVERGFIRPCVLGHRRCYSLEELRRFVAARTEGYKPIGPKDG